MLDILNPGARAPIAASPSSRWRRSARSIVLASALLFIAASTAADSLESYKSAGVVGERPDGYVGIVVANPGAELRAFVDELNAQRREKYQDIAVKNGADAESVAALAGKKLIERSATGEFVMDSAGNWRNRK